MDSSDAFRAMDTGPHDICVCSNEAETHTFDITAVELGNINITVRVSVASIMNHTEIDFL